MIRELIGRTRSCRRFREDRIVSMDTLRDLIDLARLAASAGNLQPLKYALFNEKALNNLIFPRLRWAAYLRDWKGPEEGARPPAYILVLGDRALAGSFGCDHGIASQNILLGAAQRGLGACIIGSVDRERLRKDLRIPERYEILHVIALGEPGERIVLETVGPEGDIKYWRDDEGVHHVPKRQLEDVILHLER